MPRPPADFAQPSGLCENAIYRRCERRPFGA